MRGIWISGIAALCSFSAVLSAQNNGTGLRGDYYATTNLKGAIALTRTDPKVDFEWGYSGPGGALAADKFSVRWTGQVEAPLSGAYTIATTSDDGVRLWLDGKLVIDNWTTHSIMRDQTVPIALTGGKKYNLQIEFFENSGNARLHLYWSYPGQAEQVIPTARLYPVAIAVSAAPPATGRTMISDLPFLEETNGLGPVERDRANGGVAEKDGGQISISGNRWADGLGVHANSSMTLSLDDRYDWFRAIIGVDDEVGDKGSVVFEVWLDGVKKYQSPVMTGAMPPLAIEIPVENVQLMRLVVTDAGDGATNDNADWAYARLEGKETVRYLSEMRWVSATNGLGPVERDKANGGAGARDGGQLLLRGQQYKKGLGVMAKSEVKFNLDHKYELFSAVVGVDDSAKNAGSVIFEVWSGANLLHRTGLVQGTSAPKHIALDVKGVDELTLKVLDGGDGSSGDYADWADAKLLPLGSDIPYGVLPGAPTELGAESGKDFVKLTWKGGMNTVSFSVLRSLSPNDNTPYTIESNVLTSYFVDSEVKSGKKYYYRVVGVNPNGKSPRSNEVSATPSGTPPPPPPPPGPPAPANLTAKAGNAQVQLAWQGSTGATSYSVLRGTSSGNLASLKTGITDTNYLDTTSANGTTYYYAVLAVNANGSSVKSNIVDAKPTAPVIPPPTAPTGLITSAGNGQVTLVWNGVSGATGYNVYRGTTANGESSTPIAPNVSLPTYVNTGLTNGTTYFYKVTAIGPGGESPRSNEASATPVKPPPAADPTTISALRLLRQATWGPKPGDVDRVKQIGVDAFLNEQFNAPISTYPDTLYDQSVEYMEEEFMRLALTGQDQLRQRVAFALHQIWVVSAVEVDNSRGMVNYYRGLTNNSFGNYRTLMREMTLNPAMGRYLNMLNNRSQAITGAPANENYGREIQQLFTLGLVKLNADGTPQTVGGVPAPSYTEDDVKALARIFTGWTFGDGDPATVPTRSGSENYTVPMEAVERYHDTTAKKFLGVDFPAGQTAKQDLEQALDVIFAQPGLAPFVSRQLIQKLVTSNPSPQYIADIAAVFNNNGSNVKGDLRAVVQAILKHPEAQLGTPTAGKMMEPALFIISQLRTLNANVADHPFMSDLAAEMGQKVFYSPSVFNYFSPGFRVRGTGLLGPEFQIHTSVTSLVRTNFVAQVISGSFGTDVTIDYTPFTAVAGDAAALVDYVNTLFMGGMMSSQQRQAIIDAVNVTPASNALERVKTALYLTLTSGQYYVER
jgi:uncharacterized protein (DUF1800 family)/fibronectin type 3 domain-containing protein